METAGFTIVCEEDLASKGDIVPWYSPLEGEWRHAQTLWDMFTIFRLGKLGRFIILVTLKVLEGMRLIPRGTASAARTLEVAARSLVDGGRAEIFSPMFMMVGRK
jgi:sterol 24-C-methyltransferase